MDRRLILPLTALPLAAQGSEVWKTPHTATEQTAPPNIVLFLVDDMGWQDTSVPFHECRTPLNDRYRTPNMERLAEMGVRFTAAYACAISSPSRCSLLSGMNAARHRVTNWTLDYGRATDAASDVLELPDWHWNGIQPDTAASPHNTRNATPVTTLPQLLRDHGYCTIHCGKAHFGAKTTPGADPRTMGFEVNIAGGANGAPGSYLARKNFGQGTPQEVLGLEKYYGQDLFLTDVLTREAIGALQEPIRRGQPFFLYMAHYAVHAPYEEDVRFTAHYRGRPDAQLGAPPQRERDALRRAGRGDGPESGRPARLSGSTPRDSSQHDHPLHVGQRRAGAEQRPSGGGEPRPELAGKGRQGLGLPRRGSASR